MRSKPMTTNETRLREGERIEDLHRSGYQLIQDPEEFCFGVDAVLLASFAEAKKGDTVLDLCTGTGVVPILMEARTPAEKLFGVEIQPEAAERAARSVGLNGLEEKIRIIEGDIRKLDEFFLPSSFDVITANPPYMNSGGGIENSNKPKAIARHEILCTLEDVIFAADRFLKTGGKFYMIHRPFRLGDIMALLRKYRLEPKRIRFVHPYVDKKPTMVLVEAVRRGNPMVDVMPPLIIYNKDGSYTDEVFRIYYE